MITGITELLNFISFTVAFFAFIVGAVKLFKHKVPVYYKICVCAVGCFALGGLSSIAFVLCNESYTNNIDISILGLFGCLCFLVSANMGGDNIHHREEIKLTLHKTDLFAYVAPVIVLAILIWDLIPIYQNYQMLSFIFVVIAYIPVLPASFLSLLYLIKPKDKLKMFKYTKLCNLYILSFCFVTVFYLCSISFGHAEIASLLLLVDSLLMLGLILDSIRGAKKWTV